MNESKDFLERKSHNLVERHSHLLSNVKLINDVCNLSFSVCYRYLMDEGIDFSEKAKFAQAFALKRLPERIDASVVNVNLSDELAKKLIDVMQENVLRESAVKDVTPVKNSDIPSISSNCFEPKSLPNNKSEKTIEPFIAPVELDLISDNI